MHWKSSLNCSVTNTAKQKHFPLIYLGVDSSVNAKLAGADWYYDEKWKRNVVRCEAAEMDSVIIDDFHYGNTIVSGTSIIESLRSFRPIEYEFLVDWSYFSPTRWT